MANVKITELTAATALAGTDVLPIVDVGADATKKVSVSDLLRNLPDGTASAPALAFADDQNTGVLSPGDNSLAFATSGTQRLVINSAGQIDINSNCRIEEDGLFKASNGSAAAPSHAFLDDPDNGMFRATTNTLGFSTGGSERLRIDSSGRLLVGHSSSTNVAAIQSQLQVVGADAGTGSIAIRRDQNVASGPLLVFGKSRGSRGGNTAVQANDIIGAVLFNAADGTDVTTSAARIKAEVDGTPGSNDMPGRLVFETTADGASSLTERMRIDSAGITNFYRTSGSTQLRIGTLDGSTFVSQENNIILYGSANNNYVLTRACNTADGTPGFEIVVGGTRSIEIESDGDIYNVNGTYGTISDARLKENIVDASSQWDDVKDLQVRNFNFTEASGLPTNTQIGFVAQEVEQVSPGLVKTNPDLDQDGNDLGTTTKAVKTSVLLIKAVKALQEAMDRIETLEAKVAALEAQ